MFSNSTKTANILMVVAALALCISASAQPKLSLSAKHFAPAKQPEYFSAASLRHHG